MKGFPIQISLDLTVFSLSIGCGERDAIDYFGRGVLQSRLEETAKAVRRSRSERLLRLATEMDFPHSRSKSAASINGCKRRGSVRHHCHRRPHNRPGFVLNKRTDGLVPTFRKTSNLIKRRLVELGRQVCTTVCHHVLEINSRLK